MYNETWIIAGFDLEHNQVAADGTTYDNGYGIMLIPETELPISFQWNTTNTTSGGYIKSSIHKNKLPIVSNNLKNILGDHLVNRNVLLSSNTNGGTSSEYTWTTAYCTLPSVGQLTGTFSQHSTKYDDGEANYKLPLFNYMDYWTKYPFLLRNIYSSARIWYIEYNGDISNVGANYEGYYVRPLIYIR